MAKPRVFISSTYYDLRHIRASLDIFVDSLGFEPVLSEKGDIAYSPDRPLDESCYREVENSDILVLIVGGRYGSEASAESKRPTKSFFDRYESITKREYESAVEKDIPTYVLIEKGVYAEYQTYVRNKDVKNIKYVHVESVNVFVLIEDILAKPRNNPIHAFEKFEEIEHWLREQWAGLFRELLRRQSQQQQLTGLSAQVSELKETNETLKKYLEAVMRGVDKKATSKLIESEEKRLDEVRRLESLRTNRWVQYLTERYNLNFDDAAFALRSAPSFGKFSEIVGELSGSSSAAQSRIIRTLVTSEEARADFNSARVLLEQPPIELTAAELATVQSRMFEDVSSSRLDALRAQRGRPSDRTAQVGAIEPLPADAAPPLEPRKARAAKKTTRKKEAGD